MELFSDNKSINQVKHEYLSVKFFKENSISCLNQISKQ